MLGQFRVGALLAEDASILVYQAVHAAGGWPAALKVLREPFATNSAARARFQHSAEALTRITHANVISVFDCSSADAPVVFLASEILVAESLAVLLNEHGVIGEEAAAAIFVQALDGLAAIHATGLVHGELSLDNILVCEDGRVVLSEFGLVAENAPGEASPTADLRAAGLALALTLLGKQAVLDAGGADAASKLHLTPALRRVLNQLLTPGQNESLTAAAASVALRAALPAVRDEMDEVAAWLGGDSPSRLAERRAEETAIVTAANRGDDSAAIVMATHGRYDVYECIGHGSMGKVYRGRSTTFGDVAIKVMNPHALEDSRLRLHREALALARIEHPNVMQLLDYAGPRAPLPFLVFELIVGETLDRIGAIFREREAIAVGVALAEGLAAAHAANIVHRDLKPENVFLTAAGRVVLGDFGLVRGLDRVTGALLARTGTAALGNPNFSSPEQLFEPATVGPAADLFSLGAILHWLVTGHSPFESETLAQLFDKLKKGARTQLGKEYSPTFRALVDQLLQLDQQKRPASAAVVAQRLRKMFGPGEPRQTLASFLVKGTSLTPRPARLPVTAIVLFVVAVVAGGIWLRVRSGVDTTVVVAVPPVPITPLRLEPDLTPPATPPRAPSPLPALPPTAKRNAEARPATLQFFTTPWAKIIVDGTPQGTTPMFHTLLVSPGAHTLRFENPARQSQERSISVSAGETKEIRVSLEK